MADSYKIDSKEAFNIQSDDDIDRIMNSYSDEDFIEYIRLDEDYDKVELAEKIALISSSISTSDAPNVAIMLKLFRKIYERLLKRIEDDDSEEEETTIKVPKAPKVIKKRHTLVVNSSKRVNRSQPTTSFSWQLDQEISNVKSLSIESYNIPKNWYNIDSSIGNDFFAIEYVQPMKILFEKEPETIETDFFNKSPANISNTVSDDDIKKLV